MGTFYFFIRNTILTISLVSALQLKIGEATLETRLLNLIRSKVAQEFLGGRPALFNQKSLELSDTQMNEIREKVGESKFFGAMQAKAIEEAQENLKKAFKRKSEFGKTMQELEAIQTGRKTASEDEPKSNVPPPPKKTPENGKVFGF